MKYRSLGVFLLKPCHSSRFSSQFRYENNFQSLLRRLYDDTSRSISISFMHSETPWRFQVVNLMFTLGLVGIVSLRASLCFSCAWLFSFPASSFHLLCGSAFLPYSCCPFRILHSSLRLTGGVLLSSTRPKWFHHRRLLARAEAGGV